MPYEVIRYLYNKLSQLFATHRYPIVYDADGAEWLPDRCDTV